MSAEWVVEINVRQVEGPPEFEPPPWWSRQVEEDESPEWSGSHQHAISVPGPLTAAVAAYQAVCSLMFARDKSGALFHFPEGKGYVRLATADDMHRVVGIHMVEDGQVTERW